MTCRTAALRNDLEKQYILIAIGADLGNLEGLARAFALLPQALARPAPEMRQACLAREPQGLVIHVRKHEHGAVGGIRDDRADQAMFIESGAELASFLELRHYQSEKPPPGERTSSMNRAWSIGFDLNSPVNCVVMVATLRLLTPRSDMH